MTGSSFGSFFRIHTWGESHGPAIGVTIDGVPSLLSISAEEIQKDLNRRRPGQSQYATPRSEPDQVEILSGVFEGKTTGAPLSLMVRNTSQRSGDYSEIAHVFRPGHADFGFTEKYGIRDYRGGGRSSGRETIARVAAGAVARKLLSGLGISLTAYAEEIAGVRISSVDYEEIEKNPLRMPDHEAYEKASVIVDQIMKDHDSAGGIVACEIKGVMPGLGSPVFEKLDAALGAALFSIGAVKGVEIGDGFKAAGSKGSLNNDAFCPDPSKSSGIGTKTNHSGGILGGISDGETILCRCAFKPTPSIFQTQETVNEAGEAVDIAIKGRHDPLVVPRAVVVVEAMCALTIADAVLAHMTCRYDRIKDFYGFSGENN